MPEEFPSFATVLRSRSRFYAAIMTWDAVQERYAIRRGQILGRKRKCSTDAKIDATNMAFKWGIELRIHEPERNIAN